jgi:hypothetical protein
MSLYRSFIAAVALLAASPATSNDSMAILGMGGLVFTKSPHIEMRREDLSISAKEIVVRYVFFNRSDETISSVVAFPLPDLRSDCFDEYPELPRPSNEEKVVDFKTTAGGRPVQTRMEQKAYFGARDITAQLQTLKLPLKPWSCETPKLVRSLPQATRDDFIRQGLVVFADAGPEENRKEYVPRWSLKTTHFWEQTFLPKSETIIEHRYPPTLGLTSGTMLQDASFYNDETKKTIADYCIDQDFLRTVARNKSGFEEQRISYILKTGANWAGPIQLFRLVIDKGSPKNLVSFCGEGVRKISPTRFELTKQNFTPTEDLDILILSPYPAN